MNIYIDKLKYVFIAFALVLGSCAIDDDAAVLTENQKIILVSLDKSGQHFISPNDGTDVVIKAVLSEPITNLSQIILDVNGVEQIKQISPGETTFTVTATNIPGNVMEVTLKEAKALYTKLDLGANRHVKFISVPEADTNNVLVSLNLSDTNSGFWFTLAAFNENGSWEADIFGGPNTNTIALPIVTTLQNSSSILPYYFALDIYTLGPINNPNYSISVVQPDGSISLFSGSNLDTAGNIDQDVVLVDVSDSTTPGEKIYTFTQN